MKFETNVFYHYADEYRKRPTEESELEKVDMTDEFYRELNIMIKRKEVFKININAPPANGKSITAMAIAHQLTQQNYNRPLNINDIDRDQLEYSLTIRNKKIHDTIRVIDEMNELGETGENSSIEQQLFDYFSDVMAQRNIHTISCSPTSTTDKNTNIFLEVFSMDKKTGTNYCKIYYKTNTGGIEYKQLLGHLKIDVKTILNTTWYKQYRKRKFEKMDLILQEGIFQPYKMVYAELALNVVKKLRPLTQEIRLPTQSMIRNFVKAEWSKAKMPQSIVGEVNATKDVEGIIDGYKEHWRIRKQIDELSKKIRDPKITEIQRNQIKYRIKGLEDSAKIISESLQIQETELERYKKINDKYSKKQEETKEGETT